jgi:hypothetical protein
MAAADAWLYEIPEYYYKYGNSIDRCYVIPSIDGITNLYEIHSPYREFSLTHFKTSVIDKKHSNQFDWELTTKITKNKIRDQKLLINHKNQKMKLNQQYKRKKQKIQ